MMRFNFYATIISMEPSNKITFINKPLFSTYEIETKTNERRLALIPHVEVFLKQHSLFKDKDVLVTFPAAGSSSFTCIIEAEGIKRVLKIPLSPEKLYESEGAFLRAWEKVGVKVPHVIEEGKIDGSHYLLMEFIDAKPLPEVYKKGAMIREEIFVKMGSVLRMMHNVKAEGFGVMENGKGNYSKFSEWLEYLINEKVEYVNDVSLLDDSKHGNLSLAIQKINEYVGISTESSYCHNDFAYQNIFATDPLTVFDPVPLLDHPYMDLARAIVTALGREMNEEASEHLIRGYAGNDLFIDRSALQAVIILQSHWKFGRWSKVGKENGIKNVQAYLEKTKGYL